MSVQTPTTTTSQAQQAQTTQEIWRLSFRILSGAVIAEAGLLGPELYPPKSIQDHL